MAKSALNTMLQSNRISNFSSSMSYLYSGKTALFQCNVSCTRENAGFSAKSEAKSTKKEAEEDACQHLLALLAERDSPRDLTKSALILGEFLLDPYYPDRLRIEARELDYVGVHVDSDAYLGILDAFDIATNEGPTTWPIFARMCFQYALKEEIDADLRNEAYSAYLKEVWGKIMHALNGNVKKNKSNVAVTVSSGKGKEVVKISGLKKGPAQRSSISTGKISARGKKRVDNRLAQLNMANKVALNRGNTRIYGSEIQRVLRSFAAPGLDPPLRFSSAYTTAESVVASPFARSDLEIAAQIPPDTEAKKAWAFAFREPTRAMILPKLVGSGDVSDYECWFVSSDDLENASNQYRFYPDAKTPLPIAFMKPKTTDNTLIHGPFLATGKTRSVPAGYMLWQNGMTIGVQLGVSGGLGRTFVIEFFKWNPEGEVQISELTINDLVEHTVTFSNFNIGYVRAVIYLRNDSTGSVVDFSLISPGVPQVLTMHMYNNAAPLAFYGQLMLPHYSDLMSSAEKIRINAYSLMFTNTTPVLTKGGTIVSRQTPGDEPWYELVHLGFAALSGAKGADSRNADNGVYMFARPTDPLDFAQLDDIDVSGGDVLGITFDLDLSRQYLATVVDYPDTTTRGYFTHVFNVEFLTDNSWFNPSSYRIDSSLFERAVAETRNIPQFHENPLHLTDIWNTAKKVAGGIMKYGPAVLKAAEMIGPLLV